MDEASPSEPESLELARGLCEYQMAQFHTTRNGAFAWFAIHNFLEKHPGEPLPEAAVDYLRAVAKAVIEHAGNSAVILDEMGLQQKKSGQSPGLPFPTQLEWLQCEQLYRIAKGHQYSDAQAYRWIAKLTGQSLDAIEQIVLRAKKPKS
jgi:hypothetical protein